MARPWCGGRPSPPRMACEARRGGHATRGEARGLSLTHLTVARGTLALPRQRERGRGVHAASPSPQQQIGQLEILAGLVPYTSLPHLFVGRQVLHWIDDTSVMSALTKGYSGAPDSAVMVHAFLAYNLALRAQVWFEYVNTHANVSDRPSREGMSGGRYAFGIPGAAQLGSAVVPAVLPSRASWGRSVADWAASATSDAGRGRAERGAL